MKVLGLNGKLYTLNTKKYIVRANSTIKKSQYHLKARKLLKEMFPGQTILEEMKLPGSTPINKNSVLFLDFFVPNVSLGIEVHGRQHYEYCPHFHKSKLGFLQANFRDRVKQEWCELNKIELVVLKYSDELDKWRQQIERN